MSSTDAAPRPGAVAALACFAGSFGFLLITHLPFLDLPYHWDELGYFIPAAHDVLTRGLLVPRSTLPNVHPPLLMTYLAAAWKLFGFAIPVTRMAMLAIGAATVAAAFALARRLGAGAFALGLVAALLLVSPPFAIQSMLAHLDLLSALWALLAIGWFLDGRLWLCTLASTALALTKETGILLPLVFAAFAWRDKKQLAPLALPFAALAGWLLLLHSTTGHWLGNAEFAEYNIGSALRLGRVPLVLLRRLYQLGFSNFHWIASAAIVLAVRRRALPGPRWKLVAAIIAVYLAFHSILGGAILLRYLLPALALFYIAAAAAIEALPQTPRFAAATALLAGLAISNWWNPPFPFGYEDNLAVVDFVRLHQQAARWLEQNASGKTITTAWPLSDALTNPLLGYVSRPLPVAPIDDFQPDSWQRVDPAKVVVVALYSRSWDPLGGIQHWPPAATLLRRYFAYTPQVPRDDLVRRFHLRTLARWDRRGQWMEIFVIW